MLVSMNNCIIRWCFDDDNDDNDDNDDDVWATVVRHSCSPPFRLLLEGV